MPEIIPRANGPLWGWQDDGSFEPDIQTVNEQLAEISTNLNIYTLHADGLTDDYSILQQAFNDTPAYGTIIFPFGKQLLISQAITRTTPITIKMNGSCIILNNSASPNNRIFSFSSPKTNQQTWTQTVTKGTTKLTPISNTSGYSIGDYVAVFLGQDPYDSNQEHWFKIAKVTAVDSSSITIDSPVEYDVNVGSKSNNIYKITALNDFIEIEGGNFDFATGAVPDRLIDFYLCKNVSVKNVKAKKASILFLPNYSENVEIENVDATVISNGSSSSGRLCGGWKVRNLKLKNINVYTKEDLQVLYFESRCDGISIDNFKIFSTATGVTNPFITLYGGTKNVEINNLAIDSVVNKQLLTVQGASYKINGLSINNTVKSAYMDNVEGAFSYNGVDYGKPVIYRIKDVALGANLSDFRINLPQGIYKKVAIYINSLTDINTVYLMNSNNGGTNIVSQLTAGATNIVASSLGSDYPWNDPTYPAKHLGFYTGATANAKISIYAEYYPINNDYGLTDVFS